MIHKLSDYFNVKIGDVLNLFGEDGPTILTQFINNTYETGEWPRVFTEFAVAALKNKSVTTKCSDRRIVNLIAHTAQIVATIYRRKIERKIDDVLVED
jgi:hypothetical protein